MSVLGRMVGVGGTREQALAIDTDQPRSNLFEAFFGAGTQAGKLVTFESAIRLSTVFACVRILADTVGTMPLCFYNEGADGSAEKAKTTSQWTILHDSPNEFDTAADLWSRVMVDLNTDGNAFLEKEFDAKGNVIALYALAPERIRIERSGGRKLFWVKDGLGRELPKPFTGATIIHISGLSRNGVRGLSPLSAAREAIGSGLGLDEYMNRFWAQSGVPRGTLSTTKTLSQEAVNKLRQRWNALYAGSKNAGKVAVLEDGMKFEAISISQKDAQFVEQHALSVAQIARFFRVPLSKIGADSPNASLTYRTVESDNLGFLIDGVSPWNVRIEQALRRDPDLFPLGGPLYPEFLADAFLRTDTLTRYKAYQIALGNKPFMLPSEARGKENMPLNAELDEAALAPPPAPIAPPQPPPEDKPTDDDEQPPPDA